MESNYDEDLSENSFFQILQSDHSEIFQTATLEGWVICVPRAGALPKYTLSQDDFLSHILIPSDELPESHYRTLNDKEVRISNRLITVEQDDIARPHSTHILFEETYYNEEMLKYKVLCVESSLERSTANAGGGGGGGGGSGDGVVNAVLTLRDCIDLLWTESTSKQVFEEMDGAIADFLSANADLELRPMQALKDAAGALYALCLRISLRDRRLRDKAQRSQRFLHAVQVAVETYVHHGVHAPLMRGLTACVANADARLNKAVRALAELQLRDLDVRPDLDLAVSRARTELAAVDRYATVLGKVGCVRRAVRALTSPTAAAGTAGTAVAADDLLPAVVFAVIKSRVANWTAQVAFLRQFRFSAADAAAAAADETEFLVTTLEAAVEHVRSGVLQGSSAPEGQYLRADADADGDSAPEDEDSLAWPAADAASPQSVAGLFALVRRGDIDAVIALLDRNAASPLVGEVAGGRASADRGSSLAGQRARGRTEGGRRISSGNDGERGGANGDDGSRLACDTSGNARGGAHGIRASGLADGKLRPAKGGWTRDGLCHPLCTCPRCESAISRRLCRTSPTVLSCDPRGVTALHVACLADAPQLVDLLVARGSNLAAADCSGATPMHYACAKGRQNATLLLAHAGAELAAADNEGNTPLHLAADHGHDGCVDALLYFSEHAGAGLDVNAANAAGDTALHHAARWGFEGIVRSLVAAGASPALANRRGATPLALAHSRHIGSALAATGPPGPARPGVESGRAALDFVEAAAADGAAAPRVETGERPESTSAMRGVERLLRAVAFGDARLAAFYLGVPCPVPPPSTKPTLAPPPQRCHPLCVCPRCQADSDGEEEPASAPPSSRELVSVNACDAEGETALHVASRHGRAELATLLASAGARVNARARGGRTPLHLAARHGRHAVAAALLAAPGVAVDARDDAGWTPLHHAAAAGDRRMVGLLIAHHADADAANADGLKASDVAAGNTRLNVLSLLRGGRAMALT